MTLSVTDCTVNWSGAVVGLEVELQAVHTAIHDNLTLKFGHSSYKYNKNSPVSPSHTWPRPSMTGAVGLVKHINIFQAL